MLGLSKITRITNFRKNQWFFWQRMTALPKGREYYGQAHLHFKISQKIVDLSQKIPEKIRKNNQLIKKFMKCKKKFFVFAGTHNNSNLPDWSDLL